MFSLRRGLPTLLLGITVLAGGLSALPAQAAVQLAPVVSHDKKTKPLTTDELTKDPASLLVLVSRDKPLKPENYLPKDLRTVSGSSDQLRKEAATALENLLKAGRKDGHALTMLSAYRSFDRQQSLFNQYKARYGLDYTTRISAPPGTSEHQLGLATDLGLANSSCDLKACFGETAGGKWLAENAQRFGFIIRYPADGEKITGYKYEPWHLRYIGVEHAQAMTSSNAKTFEDYHAALVKASKVKPLTQAQINEQRESLMVLRFLPPYRDWSVGYDFAR